MCIVFSVSGMSQSIDASLYVPVSIVENELSVSSGHEAYSLDNGDGMLRLGAIQPVAEDFVGIELNIYELITPGLHDGLNDTWEIEHLGLIEEYEIRVYNNWDEIIFESTDYQNDWGADDVLTGVYRYLILDISNGKKYVGNLTIEN
jgi:hypothetical protein